VEVCNVEKQRVGSIGGEFKSEGGGHIKISREWDGVGEGGEGDRNILETGLLVIQV